MVSVGNRPDKARNLQCTHYDRARKRRT
jgi:hypothetical protein